MLPDLAPGAPRASSLQQLELWIPLLFFFPGLGPSPYFYLRGCFAFRGQDMLAGCNPSQHGVTLDRTGGGEKVCSPGSDPLENK